jgi:hypothetical protein
MLPHLRQIDESVDRPQHVIGRDVLLQTEAVKQRFLHYRPLAHHRPLSRFTAKVNQRAVTTASGSFSTESVTEPTLARRFAPGLYSPHIARLREPPLPSRPCGDDHFCNRKPVVKDLSTSAA